MPSQTVLAASAIAAFLVAGTAVAILMSDDIRASVSTPELWVSSERGHAKCDDVDGTLLTADVQETSSAERRTLKYTLAAGLVGGSVSVCDAVGDVTITRSPDDRVHVTITVRHEKRGTEEKLQAADVGAAFADDGGKLSLVAWYVQPRGGDDDLVVEIDLRLPETGAYAVDTKTGVGDVLLADLLVADTIVRSGVGDLSLVGLHGSGDLVAESGVGDIDVEFASVQTASVSGKSGVGDVEILLPSRPDVGYEASAKTGVGSAEIAIGPTEEERHEDGGYGPSETSYARSKDYGSKPTQVEVQAETGTGDAAIAAR